MEYRLGPMAFHPNCPVVFLSVLRRRLEQLNSIPIPPLVHAVSLQVSRHILGCIGSYDLTNDIHERHVSFSSVDSTYGSSTSINYCPSTIKCTQHTGLLTIMFDCIYSPRVASESSSSSSIDPSTVSTASIAIVYSLTPSWTRRQGLTVYLTPLMSHLSVPSDVFLYGEGVLNHRTTLQKEGHVDKKRSSSSSTYTQTSSFAPIEASTGLPSSESPTFSDLYPVLLALRVGFDRSKGTHCITSA